MAYTYRSPDRDQLILLPSSVRDWLPADHLVWLVLELVGLCDLSRFHARHPNDGVGRRAYDPEMMLALLLYGYCTGLRSSRRIAGACHQDLAFKVICVDVVPEHDAIGRFRADHEQAIVDLFVDVLSVCHRVGLVPLGLIAVDGTKIAADAALDQNRTEAAIRTEITAIMSEAADADGTDTAKASEDRWGGPGGRQARLRAALDEIETARRAEQDRTARRAKDLADDAARGLRPRGRAPTDPADALTVRQADVTACETRLAAATGVVARLQASSQLHEARARLETAEAAAEQAPSPPERQANVVDPHSRIMKTPTGWVQGYNAQAAVCATQVIVTAHISQDHNDVALLTPMIDALGATIDAAGITDTVGVTVWDAGYWSDTNATADGPARLIATSKDWKQRKAARELGTTHGPPPADASPLEAMEHRLRTPEGAALYAQRSHTVEPVFGQTKANRGIRQFMRRGLKAVTSEWSLICTTHNINKLHATTNGTPLTTRLTT